MNVREEEEKRKNSCSGRGFGLAAAAIGVGVGAALYYFFNQRPENPNGEGSTTEDWQCEEPHTFPMSDVNSDDGSDSYSTISEHSTSDTSIEESNNSNNNLQSDESDLESESDEDEDSNSNNYSFDDSDDSFDTSGVFYNTSNSSVAIDVSIMNSLNTENTFRSPNFSVHHISDDNDSDSETAMEWDVTTSSDGLPSNEPTRQPLLGYLRRLGVAVSPGAARQMAKSDNMKRLREQAYRERSWTLEECSICFEVMLRNQEVMKLPCAHNFHSQCIMPWLQEKQTCPNCRKVA